MDLSLLKIKLGINTDETNIESIQPEPPRETGTFHSIYRLPSERACFISICKQRIQHPCISTRDCDEFWQWLAPSWYISNGYSENYIESKLLAWMLAKHGVESTAILNKILHTINFITLFAPLDVQEELLIWISESSNCHTQVD